MHPLQQSDPLTIFQNEKIWVNWKYEKTDKGELTKVPYSALITGKASSTNPDTWARYDSLNLNMGIGIMFPLDHTILGVDIDHCLEKDTTTIIHEEKETIVNFLIEADTYTEISPSKTGVHLWFKLSDSFIPEVKKHAPYEMYTSGRYFTVTNSPYKEPKPIRTISSKEAVTLLSILGYPWVRDVGTHVMPPISVQSVLEDQILLDKMFSSKNGPSIKKLYDGDITQHNNDHSSADMALCSHLVFWTQGNATQIERLWLKSPLSARDKTSIRKDYRQRTITNAIRGCSEFYKPPTDTHTQKPPVTTTKDSGSLIFLKSSEVVSKPIDWLWEGKIAKGKVSMISGDPGLGKSQASLHLASIVSTGGVFPGGYKCKQGSVLLFSAEDGAEDTINPRLQATGADGERIFIFSTVKSRDREKFFDLSSDLPLLKKALEENKDIALIVIDPITAFLGETDSHKNSEVRGLLAALSKMATEHNVAIVVVTHLNKSTGVSAMNKITGSLGFVAAARAVYMVVKDKADESRRLFLTVKNNLATDKGGFAYKVESTVVGENIGTSKVVWEEKVLTITLAEALEEDKYSKGSARTETVEWLEDYLKKYPGGVSLDVIEKAARTAGVATRRTLDRAADELFIEKVYQGRGKPKLWKIDPFNDVEPDL